VGDGRRCADGAEEPAHWLDVAGATEAIAALLREPAALASLMDRCPVLMLPELPEALEARAATSPPDVARAYAGLARTFRAMAAEGRAEHPAEYAGLLANCGLALRDAADGDRVRNVRRARALFAEARRLAGDDAPLVASLLNEEGIACRRLAALGVEPEAHLREAVALFRRARERSGTTGAELAGWLVNEALAREELAERDLEPAANLQAAAELCRRAQGLGPPGSRELRGALGGEARIRYALGERGIDARSNLEKAVALERAARDAGATEPIERARSLLHEAMARVQLGQRAVELRLHAQEALRLCAEARRLAAADPHLVGAILLEAGNAHHLLGRLGAEEAAHLQDALECYEAALRVLAPQSPEARGCQLNIAQTRAALAGQVTPGQQATLRAGGVSARYWLGLEAGRAALAALFAAETTEALVAALEAHPLLRLPELPRALLEAATGAFPEGDLRQAWVARVDRLQRISEAEHAPNPAARVAGLRACARWLLDSADPGSPVAARRGIALLQELRAGEPPGSPAVPLLLADEAEARRRLAARDGDPANLEAAILAAREARAAFGDDDPRAGTARTTEALARTELALLGREPRAHAEAARELAAEACRLAAPGSPARRAALLAEGQARVVLAHLGFEARAHLEEAIRLAVEARHDLDEADGQRGESLVLEAGARARLAELGVDPRANAAEAVRLARETPRGDPASAVEVALTEAAACIILAGLGVEAVPSLEAALACLAEARHQLPPQSRDAARCLVNEASAHLELAERGVEPRRHAEAAVAACQRARAIGQALGIRPMWVGLNEANARLRLARLGVEPASHLAAALDALVDGRRWLDPAGYPAARYLWNEVGVRTALAARGVDPEANRAEAAALGARAAAILQAVAPREALHAYRHLGAQAMERGEWNEARAALRAAIECLEAVRGTTVVVLDRREWMERNIGLFKDAVETCLRLGRADEALELAERGRSRALVDLLAVEELAPGPAVPPETAEAYRRLRRRAEELEALAGRGPGVPLDLGGSRGGVGPLAEARREVARDLRAVEDRLREADPDFLPLARPLDRPGLLALARRLDRTIVLLWVGRARGAAFLVPPGGDTVTLDLPELRDGVVRAWTLGREGQGGWLATYLGHRAGHVDLATWMATVEGTLGAVAVALAPVRRWLRDRGAARIAIVSAGALGLLPLHAALSAEPGAPHDRLDPLDAVHAPSAWLLDRCARRVRPAWTPVLAVASADGTEPLPWSEREVARIEALVEPRAGTGSVSRLVGRVASVPEVVRLLPAHPVVHFAAHAVWDPAEPLRSAVLLAGGEHLTIGRLLGRDRLDAARLVVLSACESAAGYRPASDAEEYLGLPAGFILAGAKAVIGTLWAVADLPTALLMSRLYEALLAGEDVAAGLRTAQRWLRDLKQEDVARQASALAGQAGSEAELDTLRARIAALGGRPFAHPHFWAPFQVLGAPDGLGGA
jgi:CHAT domain-containing protein